MKREEAIESNKMWIEETEQHINNYYEVIEALKKRIIMFKERIRRYELEEEKGAKER